MRVRKASAARRKARRNTTVSIDPALLELADQRAAAERRTRSNYLAWLIERDAQRQTEAAA